ncbi:MAG: hypothetical protein Q8L27_02940 [archaeon]|nr:hypothetical protein [archaeon]
MSDLIDKGFSSHTFILFGFALSSIQVRISNFLESNLEKHMMLHNLKEEIMGLSEQDTFKKNRDDRIKLNQERINIERQLSQVNKEIKDINKNVLKPMEVSYHLLLLEAKVISKLILARFSSYHSSKETIRLHNENLRLNILNEFKPLSDSIVKIIRQFKDRERFDGLDNLSKELRRNAKESINIFSIGYGKTGVLCIGRTIENEINNYLKILFKTKKITPEKFKEFKDNKYNNKIGFLKDRFLNEEEFTKLKAFSFDRDKGGHPNLGEIDNSRAKTLIQQGIWLVIDLQKKISKLENKSK